MNSVTDFTTRLFKHIARHGNKNLYIGGGILIVIFLAAIFAPLLTKYSPYTQDLMHRREPPIWYNWFGSAGGASWDHPLGTDKLGRDYWARLVYGARISLLVGLAAVALSAIIGTTLGVLAGYFGGKVDLVVSFIITTRLSMPVVLVALAVVSLNGSSVPVLILVMGFLLWDRFAIVMRTATQQARTADYVIAARAAGCSTARIILREILPNIMAAFIIIVTIELAIAILLEAALSFLGMGVQPPNPSWGLMLAEAKDEMFFAAWMITIPGVALTVLILAINIFGDGMRDLTTKGGQR